MLKFRLTSSKSFFTSRGCVYVQRALLIDKKASCTCWARSEINQQRTWQLFGGKKEESGNFNISSSGVRNNNKERRIFYVMPNVLYRSRASKFMSHAREAELNCKTNHVLKFTHSQSKTYESIIITWRARERERRRKSSEHNTNIAERRVLFQSRPAQSLDLLLSTSFAPLSAPPASQPAFRLHSAYLKCKRRSIFFLSLFFFSTHQKAKKSRLASWTPVGFSSARISSCPFALWQSWGGGWRLRASGWNLETGISWWSCGV